MGQIPIFRFKKRKLNKSVFPPEFATDLREVLKPSYLEIPMVVEYTNDIDRTTAVVKFYLGGKLNELKYCFVKGSGYWKFLEKKD